MFLAINTIYCVKSSISVLYRTIYSTPITPPGWSASNNSKEVSDGCTSIAKLFTVKSAIILLCKLSTVASATLSGTSPLTITLTLTVKE